MVTQPKLVKILILSLALIRCGPADGKVRAV